jgi:ribonuclease-3
MWAGLRSLSSGEVNVDTPQRTAGEAPWEFAERLGLPFLDHLLLSRAFTHRSYLNEHPEALEDNERLEFLGDAVLDFLVASWLYNRFPEMSEGELTRLRSALVKTEQLAQFALDIQLGGAMRLGRGEEESGGRERPALLCATFEALVGALYLAAGIDAVLDFMKPLLATAADNILIERRDLDPKSMLQEWAQSKGYQAPTYRTIAAEGPDHAKVFEVEVLVNGEVAGRGSGQSKQAATKTAARDALTIQGLS